MSAAVETGGFDEIAQRAVEAAEMPGALEEAVEEASKSERIMRPSMAVSMFRGRRHISANIDPNNVAGDNNPLDSEPMDIKPLEAEAYVLPEEVTLDLGLDPMMVWKADLLRALRSAPDGTMALSDLSSQVSNPMPQKAYNEQVQEHLISRNLAKWVVENESVQILLD